MYTTSKYTNECTLILLRKIAELRCFENNYQKYEIVSGIIVKYDKYHQNIYKTFCVESILKVDSLVTLCNLYVILVEKLPNSAT